MMCSAGSRVLGLLLHAIHAREPIWSPAPSLPVCAALCLGLDVLAIEVAPDQWHIALRICMDLYGSLPWPPSLRPYADGFHVGYPCERPALYNRL